MAMHIELARTMVYKAAWLKDQGKRFKKEAAIAKLYASEICMKACDQASNYLVIIVLRILCFCDLGPYIRIDGDLDYSSLLCSWLSTGIV